MVALIISSICASMSAVSTSGSAMHADAISMPATAATVEGSSSLPSSAVTVSSVGEATATDTGFHAERPPVKATSPDSSALFSSFTVKLCLAALANMGFDDVESVRAVVERRPFLLGFKITGRIVVDGFRECASTRIVGGSYGFCG